jgi:predicted nucleotidyltransferase
MIPFDKPKRDANDNQVRPPDFLLDAIIEKKSKKKEEQRLGIIEKVLAAIDKLSLEIAFKEAYLFGSVTKPHRFSERSDLDIGFLGLDDRDFFRVMSYLSREVGRDVDVIQLEEHRLTDKIKTGGIRWKRKD